MTTSRRAGIHRDGHSVHRGRSARRTLRERSSRPTRALAALVVATALVACGGGGLDGPEWTVARPRPAPATASPELSLGALVLRDDATGEELARLSSDGTVSGTPCATRVGEDGRVLRASGGALRVRGDGVLAPDDALLFRLEEGRLLRPDGVAARFEGEVLALPDGQLTLRVEGADTPALQRTALVLVAALGACE